MCFDARIGHVKHCPDGTATVQLVPLDGSLSPFSISIVDPPANLRDARGLRVWGGFGVIIAGGPWGDWLWARSTGDLADLAYRLAPHKQCEDWSWDEVFGCGFVEEEGACS